MKLKSVCCDHLQEGRCLVLKRVEINTAFKQAVYRLETETPTRQCLNGASFNERNQPGYRFWQAYCQRQWLGSNTCRHRTGQPTGLVSPPAQSNWHSIRIASVTGTEQLRAANYSYANCIELVSANQQAYHTVDRQAEDPQHGGCSELFYHTPVVRLHLLTWQAQLQHDTNLKLTGRRRTTDKVAESVLSPWLLKMSTWCFMVWYVWRSQTK